MLAACASVTERIVLGTGVVLTPLHHPLRLAEDSAVVDLLSDGRLILGLGLGWRQEEFRMFGVDVSERLQRTIETIEILRRAWTGRRFSFEGRSFRLDRVRVTPPPARRGGPPIYLGGYTDRSLRRAGTLADGYITDDDPEGSLAPQLELLDEGARRAGRDPRRIGLALLRNVFVSSDGDAWAIAREGVAHQLGSYTAWEAGADTPERDELHPEAPNERDLRVSTVAGTPAEIVRALRPTVEAFGDRDELHVVVRLHYPGMDLETAARAAELFASDVAPALRAS
jgi:probable F420-dependent oxidoreductase